MEPSATDTWPVDSIGLLAADGGSRGTAGSGGGQVLFDDGTLRITRAGGQPWLVIAGEIDEAGYAGLLRAICEVSGGPGDIHIDLAGVQYFDLAGLRAFVLLSEASAGRPGPGGRCVLLHQIPAPMKTTLEILGWDCVPDLVIASTRAP